MKEILERPVSHYMQKDVLLLDSTSTISLASELMKRREQENVVVVKDTKPVGIVTDQDIINNLAQKGVSPFGSSLELIMSSPLITIEPDAKVKDALIKMRESKIRKLVVIENGTVQGMITQPMIAAAIRNSVISKPKGIKPGLKSVLGNLGFVLQFAGILMIIPALLSTFMDESVTATGIYLMSVSLLAVGFFLNSYGEKAPLNLRQSSVLVLCSFVLLSLFGMIPYIYLNPYNASDTSSLLVDSFFSSSAGFTTGGLTLFTTPEDLPQSFRFYRSFTQWVGGMSFIYLVMTAFYPEGKLSGMTGFITGRALRLRELLLTITLVFGIYVLILSALLYLLGESNTIDDISLVLSTIVSGGFLPTSTILAEKDWPEMLVLIGGMILAALPFSYHYSLIKRRFLTPKLTREIMVYLALIGFSVATFPLLTSGDYLTNVFHAISASTTTGNQIGNIAHVGDSAKAFLMLLMFVGGCGFSTAGGIKILRLINPASLGKRLRHKKTRMQMNKQDAKELISTIIIIILFPLLSYFTALHIMNQGFTFADAYFESVSAITTGGLSVGVSSVGLDPASKVFLSINMILGRFEIIAIIHVLVPRLMQQ